MKQQIARQASGRLSLLGSPRLVGCSGAEVPLPAKAYFLIAFLVLDADGFAAPRTELAHFLWEDADPRVASSNLRQLLARIRKIQKASGIEIVTAGAAHIRLKRGAVTVDLVEVEQLVGALDRGTLPRLLELFTGDLLMSLPGATEPLRAWVTDQRERLRESFITAATRWMNGKEAASHPDLVREAARRVLDLDPCQEAAYRSLMRVHAAEGRIWEAKRLYEQCRARLESELGVPPSAETAETLDRLLRGDCPEDPAATIRPEPLAVAEAASDRNGPRTSAMLVAAGMPKIAILMPPQGSDAAELHSVATSLLEDVTLGLCSLRTILVIAPHTSWRMSADPTVDPSVERFEIAYLVESSLHTLHDSNYLSLKLLDSRSRVILWAQRVPLGNLELATSYREISVGLITALSDAVECAELKQFEGARDRTAYYWYLMGQKHLRHIDLPSIRKARRHYETAIRNCAEFAPAYSGVARTLQMEWILLARGDEAPLARSETLARRAIDLDPRDSGGYHQLGFASLYARRFDESIAHFSEAERRHPQHADLLADFADSLAHGGRPAAGLKKLREAIALNPIVPDQYWWRGAGMNFQLRRYEEAINAALKMKDNRPAMRLIAAASALLGDKTAAEEYMKKTLETYPDFRLEHWLSIVPNRNPEDAKHYKDGLRAAGFS